MAKRIDLLKDQLIQAQKEDTFMKSPNIIQARIMNTMITSQKLKNYQLRRLYMRTHTYLH